MIRLSAFIYWCIQNGIGDAIFWTLLLTFSGFLIWLMGDAGA